MAVDSSKLDHYHASYTYEQFLLLKPQIETRGLWRKGNEFYILCPDYENNFGSPSWEELNKNFNESIKCILTPITLVNKLPDNTTEVEDRDPIDALISIPMNLHQLTIELSLAMTMLPRFAIFNLALDFKMYVETKIPEEWYLSIREFLITKVGKSNIKIEIIVDEHRDFDMPARYIPPAGCDLFMMYDLPKDAALIPYINSYIVLIDKDRKKLTPPTVKLYYIRENASLEALEIKDFRRFNKIADFSGFLQPKKISLNEKQIFEMSNLNGGHIPNCAIELENLIPAKLSSNRYSPDLLTLLQADDALWAANRTKVFSNTDTHLASSPINFNDSACLIDATIYTTASLKSLIMIYKHIIIALPLAQVFQQILDNWQVTEKDLIELAARNRILFILPQPTHRYNKHFIEKIAELPNKPIIFSRKLGLLSIQSAKSRFPLLYLPFHAHDKKKILQDVLNLKDGDLRFNRALAMQLGENWASVNSLNTMGALGERWTGIGKIATCMLEFLRGKNDPLLSIPYLAISNSALGVSWAAAFNATLLPFDEIDYSEFQASSFVANIFSNSEIIRTGGLDVFLDGLYLLNNSASIIEIEEVFRSELSNFNQFLSNTHASHQSNAEIDAIRRRLNDDVKHFEKNKSKLKKFDLSGLVRACACAMAYHHPEAATAAPLCLWLCERLMQNLPQPISDRLLSMVTLSKIDTIKLARLKNISNSIN